MSQGQESIRDIEAVRYDGSFDYITCCISPNYTPASADFIIELMKEYIDVEQSDIQVKIYSLSA